MIKTCKTCRQSFDASERRRKFCSRRCIPRDNHVAGAVKSRQRAAETYRTQKFRADISASGFWVTPELLALCQRVWKRGYASGWTIQHRVTIAERHMDVIAVDPVAESHTGGLRA